MKIENALKNTILCPTLLISVLLLLHIGGAAAGARAATYLVTNTNDRGPGSLRQAVADANATFSDDTVRFSTTGTIRLTGGSLLIEGPGSLTISGPGADRLTISGNRAGRVFIIAAGAEAALDSLTVADGRALGGGGILVLFGALTLIDSSVTGNTATALGGGGIQNQGGTVMLVNSKISGNKSFSGGSGIDNLFGGRTTLIGSLVSGNEDLSAAAGAPDQNTADQPIQDADGIRSSGPGGRILLINSRVAGNTARRQISGGNRRRGKFSFFDTKKFSWS